MKISKNKFLHIYIPNLENYFFFIYQKTVFLRTKLGRKKIDFIFLNLSLSIQNRKFL